MAGIDKTYVKTWGEYESLVRWAKDKEFVCPNGIKLYPINYIYEYDKNSYEKSYNSFKEKYPNEEYEFPVMNTSWSMDYFLIKYCPLKFIRDRMKKVYDEDYIRDVLNGNSYYDMYYRNVGGKVKIIKYPKFGNKSKLCEKKRRTKFIEVENLYKSYSFRDTLWYNEDYDYWVSMSELGDHTSNMCHKNINSTKAMIRQIIKWKLPKGSVVIWSGRYVGNEFKFLVY